MDTNNSVLFIIDCMRAIAAKLSDYDLIGVPIWTWFIGFIFVGMVVSTFWRGARG